MKSYQLSEPRILWREGGWIVSKQVELSHENWPLRPYQAGNISRFTIRHKSRGQWGKFPYYFCRQPTPIRAPGNTFQRVIHCSSISTVFQIVDLSRWIRIKRGEGELGCGTVSIEIAVPDRVPKLSTLRVRSTPMELWIINLERPCWARSSTFHTRA